MYDDQTYEGILQRMLDRVDDNVDKRQGSIIYDALAPAAAELAQMYIDLSINNELSYADTASGEYLTRRAEEFGVNRKQASYAKRMGVFFDANGLPLDVPVGSRYSIDDFNYVAVSKIGTGTFTLECEQPGAIGNKLFGDLLPIDYIDSLVRSELQDVLVPGEDEETDEALRKRYMEAVNEKPFGGNVADYKQKINSITGVGGVKVFPTWQGGGTVKATIISSDFTPPSDTLIREVQTIIDPEVNAGQGLGLAPIGHTVTITGAKGFNINVTATLTLAHETTLGQVQNDVEEAINVYLLQLRKTWSEDTAIIVRVAQIESRILTVSGVLDVNGTKLNGSGANIELTAEQIPVLGAVTLNE